MNANHPDKQLVRAFMQKRAAEHKPPPSLEQIRRELGWNLNPANKQIGGKS